MRLTVCMPEGAPRWAKALQQALPEATVSAWAPGAPAADVALVWKPPAAFWAEQPVLKAAFAAGAGVDGLLATAPPRGLPLYRLEDAGMGAQMADYVLAGLLRWFRGFDVYAAQAAKGAWRPHPPQRKADWPVGLLGAGVLAQPVREALRALGFPVQAWARTPREGQLHGDDGLRTLLAGSRVVVALLPLTEATRGLLNAERFAAMRPGSYLINVARGGLVEQEALRAALDGGLLAGALLDVCEPEPLPAAHWLWRHPKVQLTPHVAAATLRDEAVAQVAAKMRALQRGEAVSGRVSADGY